MQSFSYTSHCTLFAPIARRVARWKHGIGWWLALANRSCDIRRLLFLALALKTTQVPENRSRVGPFHLQFVLSQIVTLVSIFFQQFGESHLRLNCCALQILEQQGRLQEVSSVVNVTCLLLSLLEPWPEIPRDQFFLLLRWEEGLIEWQCRALSCTEMIFSLNDLQQGIICSFHAVLSGVWSFRRAHALPATDSVLTLKPSVDYSTCASLSSFHAAYWHACMFLSHAVSENSTVRCMRCVAWAWLPATERARKFNATCHLQQEASFELLNWADLEPLFRQKSKYECSTHESWNWSMKPLPNQTEFPNRFHLTDGGSAWECE